MPVSYLFGPISQPVAQNRLGRRIESSEVLLFDSDPASDRFVAANQTWDSILSDRAKGRRLDFVAAWAPYTTIPYGVRNAPVPLVGVFDDWRILTHHYRRLAAKFDLVVSDSFGQAFFAKSGHPRVTGAALCGCGHDIVDPSTGEPEGEATGERDIDVLFVGNLNPAIHPHRGAWLRRLSRLTDRWRVVVRSGLHGDGYRRLVSRARVIIHESRDGRWSRKLFEAAALGAVVFIPATTIENPAGLRDRDECVMYTEETLENLILEFLRDEPARLAIAERARKKSAEFTFDHHWGNVVSWIESNFETLKAAARDRRAPSVVDELLLRVSQSQVSPVRSDPTLVQDIEAAFRDSRDAVILHQALALALPRACPDEAANQLVLEKAASHFRLAIGGDSTQLLAALNWAETLMLARRHDEACDILRRMLGTMERMRSIDWGRLDGMFFRPEYSTFRMEWERAAARHAGDPVAESEAKRLLLRWRAESWLAQGARGESDLPHTYEAVLARPDLAPSRSTLGCRLANLDNPLEALPHLRQAVTDNPFDLESARALHQTLMTILDQNGVESLKADRQRLWRIFPEGCPLESWFYPPPPKSDRPLSVVVLCCNQVEYTRQCFESLLRNTRKPFEVVVVDNGSTDGTAEYLAELSKREGDTIRVLTNPTNRGFPAGCNQAIREARGDYVVFLNNDTIVTPGWADDLVACLLHDWPRVGMVGPVSNGAPDQQGISVDYDSPAGIDEFSEKRRKAFSGRLMEVQRLTGFCLMTRRDVLDRIGGFDEFFSPGFFEDDDLNLRARQAGFRLVVALPVFIHHFAHRTVHGLKLSARTMLETNHRKFAIKWGREHASHFRLPPPSPTPKTRPNESEAAALKAEDEPLREIINLPASARPKVALTMIVKNEEHNLPALLDTAADLFDEVIIVDTGSSDRTKEIARSRTEKVFDFPWIDSFAAARNEALKHATARWVMWLDADDRIDAENRDRIRRTFAQLGDETDAYAVKVRSVLDSSGTSHRLLDQVRIFPNLPSVRWQYRIHEQILPSVREAGGGIRWTEIVVDHVGYQEASARQSKLDRNLRILRLDFQDLPDDPFTLFNLGWTMMDQGLVAEGLVHLEKSLKLSTLDSSIKRKLFALVGHGMRRLGRMKEALATYREGLGHFPDDSEILFEEASLLQDSGDLTGTERSLLRLLDAPTGRYFASIDVGLRGYKSRHVLAELYRKQGRTLEAEIQWRTALAERADFAPARNGLSDLYLDGENWSELDRMIDRMDRGGASLDAGLLQARCCLARKEHHSARRKLDELIRQFPRATAPRVILSHVLLKNSRDWADAENVLRSILDLDANHPDAKHNLDVLLKKKAGVG